MIKALDAHRYAIDFGLVKRPSKGLVNAMMNAMGGVKTADVDGFAVGQALRAVLHHCNNLDVEGRLQVWNDFRLFLDRKDYESLKKKAPRLQHELGPALEDEVLKLKASYLGTPVLRLHVDENGDVEPGHGVLKVDWNADEKGSPSAAGEVTVRLDKIGLAPTISMSGSKTQRAGGALLKHAGGVHNLEAGLRYVLGRPGANPDPEQLGLPGASQKINSRQVSVQLDGTPLIATITREPGSNPVAVNGQTVPPGQAVKVPLPADLLLSNELRIEIQAC